MKMYEKSSDRKVRDRRDEEDFHHPHFRIREAQPHRKNTITEMKELRSSSTPRFLGNRVENIATQQRLRNFFLSFDVSVHSFVAPPQNHCSRWYHFRAARFLGFHMQRHYLCIWNQWVPPSCHVWDHEHWERNIGCFSRSQRSMLLTYVRLQSAFRLSFCRVSHFLWRRI